MTEQPAAKPNADDVAEIDAFCDAVWLEDGLSRASLASYRSDLGRFARWLAGQNQNLLQADQDVQGLFAAGWTTLQDLPNPGGRHYQLLQPPARIRVAPGTRLLLATDGFMRLTDLFARYSWDELFDLAARDGLSALVDELRQMEVADGDCLHVPRTKPHDDASAILLEVMG